jgi:hypothetical protein
MSETVDVIIPLSNESKSNNDELRICFRSIEKHATDVGRVIVVTTQPPKWISSHVSVLRVPDTERQNKDANIINKVLSAIKHYQIDGDFVFFSDDQCLLHDIKLKELPPIYNDRSKAEFLQRTQPNRWVKRVINTFEFLESRGIYLRHNYESHTPQRYNAPKLLQVMEDIDYRTLPGFTINTLFMGLCGVTDGVKQSKVKLTCETTTHTTQLNSGYQFCGYNDKGFLSGLRDNLLDKFSHPSLYELTLQGL